VSSVRSRRYRARRCRRFLVRRCMPLTPRVTQRWTQTARVGVGTSRDALTRRSLCPVSREKTKRTPALLAHPGKSVTGQAAPSQDRPRCVAVVRAPVPRRAVSQSAITAAHHPAKGKLGAAAARVAWVARKEIGAKSDSVFVSTTSARYLSAPLAVSGDSVATTSWAPASRNSESALVALDRAPRPGDLGA